MKNLFLAWELGGMGVWRYGGMGVWELGSKEVREVCHAKTGSIKGHGITSKLWNWVSLEVALFEYCKSQRNRKSGL
ncbi:MAG: hypothetical protein B7Z16_02855 [Algoriphagus sp. 32-45-6]|nr:MAG: hypothetical protein B7Z16_02855 [Algoriphagus sp. 32-45-6]